MLAKTKKNLGGGFSLRPSIFLNEFDLNTLIKSPKLSEDSNNTSIKLEEPKPRFNMKEKRNSNIIKITFPSVGIISPKPVEQPDYTNMMRSQKIEVCASEQVSPQANLKLPEIQFNTPQKLLVSHKRNLTDGNLPKKRVEFRPSVLLIDFTNDSVSKGQIDGSVKPLKRLKRQQTKFQLPLLLKK